METTIKTATINGKNKFSIDNILSKPNKLPCFGNSQNCVISEYCTNNNETNNNNNEKNICANLCEQKFTISNGEILTIDNGKNFSAPDSSCSDDIGDSYMSDVASEGSNCK